MCLSILYFSPIIASKILKNGEMTQIPDNADCG